MGFRVRYNSGQEVVVNAIDGGAATALDACIAGDARALRPDGSYYNVQVKFGGFVLDGCPLNSKGLLGPGLTTEQLGALASINLRPVCSPDDAADYDRFLGVPASSTGGVTGGGSGCSNGVCGPSTTTGVTTTPVTNTTPNTTPNVGSASPTLGGGTYGSGGLGGGGSSSSGSPGGMGAAATPASSTATSTTGFDFVAFLKGPMGMLLIVLVIVLLLLTRKGG